MYKPPQNSNRVNSIKNKFENIENNTSEPSSPLKTIRNGTRSNLSRPCKEKNNLERPNNTRQPLTRQLSDPLKRNIKRTPAFRVEKNVDSSNSFQRNCFANKSTLFENKVKQFSALKTTCDVISNNNNNNSSSSGGASSEDNRAAKLKPILLKSKSSHDFEYIRSKFDKANVCSSTPLSSVKNRNIENQRSCNDSNEKVIKKDLSALYTEPIPKSLRAKRNVEPIISNVSVNGSIDIHSSSTLKLCDIKSLAAKPPITVGKEEYLTDTLKTALKRPLPSGPAPKKPPRTFQHSSNKTDGDNLEKNVSFLHLTKEIEKKLSIKQKPKSDPKYMLNKLENALRNNKLRYRKQVKTDISTSGEDSDDSLLFRSKAHRTLPKIPTCDSPETYLANESHLSNLNCLQSMNCTGNSNPYEKIKEPTSSFFVVREEPVYAEPFHFQRTNGTDSSSVCERQTNNRNIRNSLYYLSTPVVGGNTKMNRRLDDMSLATKADGKKLRSLNLATNGDQHLIYTENSSLSSGTSDLDSTPSPLEEDKYKFTMDRKLNSCIMDSDVRVDQLKSCLRQTLNNSFRDVEQDGCDFKVADMISKFQTYISKVPKYCQPKIHKDTLFYCCLIVERVAHISQIKFKFPSFVQLPQHIETLCFPENEDVVLDSSSNCYSLSLTNDKGERSYGYCRRVLPEGSPRCLPLAYCILSKYKAPRFYQKILKELESRHGIRDKYRDELISQFYSQKFPRPGESIRINIKDLEFEPHEKLPTGKGSLEESLDLNSYVHVRKRGEYASVRTNNRAVHVYMCPEDVAKSNMEPNLIVQESDRTELILTLHKDILYEDSDLIRLHKLPVDIIQKVFSSLLLERKVVLVSSVISDLSACVESLQSLLHPFTWCHTFIPILPETLWDVVESPTPVICGVLSTEVVKYHNIQYGIVVDIDSGTVLVQEGDENKIMSGTMQKEWRKSLAITNKSDIDYVHSVHIRQAYLQVFRLCFHSFQNYVVDGNFQKEEFIKNGKTKGIRRFLKMFTETYMFVAFVDSVLSNPENHVSFDDVFNIKQAENYNQVIEKLSMWKK